MQHLLKRISGFLVFSKMLDHSCLNSIAMEEILQTIYVVRKFYFTFLMTIKGTILNSESDIFDHQSVVFPFSSNSAILDIQKNYTLLFTLDI